MWYILVWRPMIRNPVPMLFPSIRLPLAAALLAAACTGGPDAPPERREVVVFAAASLRDALEELGGAFEAGTGVRVLFNFAGSHVLARQIAAAPGADLFLSASKRWMDEAARAGRLVPGTRRELLSNRLVVVAHARSPLKVETPCALAALPLEHLALGDPDAVPAGAYARDWLRSVECDGRPLWEAVRERVAPAPDVRAALALVLAEPDVPAIVYRTDWRAFADRTRVLYEVTDGPAIRYLLAQVAGGAAPEEARRFLEYLSGAEAARVFEKHGFTVLPAAR
jgi:molybdate transport system substrate-binding protein